MKKRIAAIMTALFMLPTTSFASIEVTLDKEADKINVSGESNHDNVSLMLLNPSYTLSDTEDSTLSEAVRFYRPIEVSGGEYSCVIKMPSSAGRGVYTLYADSDKKDIYYASATERLSMVAEVKTAIEEETLPSYLSVNGAYLCDSEKFLKVTDLSKASSLTEKILSEKVLTANSPESLEVITKALDFSTVVQLLNENKVNDISEVGKIADENEMAIKYSQKSLIPTNKQGEVISRISGKNITTEEGFYKALQESIFIGVINESKTLSSTQRRQFFDDYAADAGLDVTSYSSLGETERSSAATQLSVGKKTTISDMQALLNTLCPPETPGDGGNEGNGGNEGDVGGNGGNGGNGGGGHLSASGTGGGKTESKPKEEKEEAPVKFTDMDTYSWAEEAVNTLSTDKIINGYADGTFKPEGSITRGEFTAMIARAFLPAYSGNSRSFSDVNIADWHYDFVMAAYEQGIVNGMGEGKFLPGEKIRRCDMAVILNNLLTYKGMALEGSALAFKDTASIPGYATEAVSILNANKIINGDDNNNFRANDFANRAEAAVMLHRFINLTKGEGVK